jgi:hypothetical protein
LTISSFSSRSEAQTSRLTPKYGLASRKEIKVHERLTVNVIVVDDLGVVILQVAVAVNPSDGNTSWEDGTLIHTRRHGIS